jgi:DNA adenine methylase
LAPTLAPAIHARLAVTRGRYIEPFLGGAAIALDLGMPRMLLGDACQPLITMYQAVVKFPDAVDLELRTLVERGTDEESYYRVRAKTSRSHVAIAARFIYINKLGFNGLYRENSQGLCNVPYGKDPNKGLPTLEHIRAVANAFKTSEILVQGALQTIARAQRGDVIYADPPYLATFSNYTAGGFNDDAHATLAQALRAAHARGVMVVASNTDHERIRELYDWATIIPIHEHHVVAADDGKRGKKAAVLITSDQTLLGP